MDEQQRISSVASSSNSSSMLSSKKCDVFLSFRGEDTHLNFTSHLYKALNEKSVKTYIDDQLQKGDKISSALTEAIEDSHVSIVIFSENYASSKWCLDELSKILECKKVQEQIVIPVFYNVDPSHVRKQSGSYEQAFGKHKGDSRFNTWKTALTEAAGLAGWDSRNRTEPEFLEDIVEYVLKKLAPRYTNQRKGQVGIEKSYEQLELLLKIGSDEVKALGIWGMGGIGKTTLATALYDGLSCKFEGRCFLANIKGKSDELKKLREELFNKLLRNKNLSSDTSEMIRLLRHKKVFIFLDDVDTSIQLEELIYKYDFLGPGSRVIVTTRDKKILRPRSEIYPVQDLSPNHSLQLFCLAAFGEKQAKDGYEDLSRAAISYCKGIPLALKVLGASFRERSKEAWECELEKLQKIPNMEIHKVLKLSYDGLDRLQQNIFLDIACFFVGEYKYYVTSALEAFDFFPQSASGIDALVDKALITISKLDEIEMHDLIQDMGQEIVHQESIKDPGRRSRLWKHEEVLDVLKLKYKGTNVVEGIILDLHKLNADLYFRSNSLAKMTNMRFLKIYYSYSWKSHLNNKSFKVNLPNGLESLSNKLRYLEWYGCCLESLPPNFCAEELVEIRMRDSKLKKLWDGVQNLVNLKIIDLVSSQDLIEIPDFSKAEKLETVDLSYCESLHQLHPSILSHPKLTCLRLSGCRKIERLNVDSKSLRELNLGQCSSLKEILVTSKQMTYLGLSNTAIRTFSSSMLSVPKLTCLDVKDCKEIESLNLNLKYLEKLHLDNYSSLKEISVTSNEMITLNLTGTAIYALSSSMLSLPTLKFLLLNECKEIESLDLHLKDLVQLSLGGCSSLKKISVKSEYLQELYVGRCSSLMEISVTSKKMTALRLSGTAICAFSSSMLSLPKLTYLDVSHCKEIDSLNVDLKYLGKLNLRNCSSLKEISVMSETMTWLDLSGTAIRALPSWIGRLLSLGFLNLKGSEVESLDENIKNLPMLRILRLDNCRNLVSLPKLPPSLDEVSAYNCISMKTKITQQLVLHHMLQSSVPHLHIIIPGDHVINNECGFRTAKSSITIPYLPISHLCGFIYCIVLSMGLFSHDIFVSIHQDDIKVGWDHNDKHRDYENPISDHVIFWYHDVSKLDRISEMYDHFSDITFTFEYEGDKERIKGCAVFPVYATSSGLKLL